MMALRLIIFVSFVAVLANGCGKGDTTNPTPCPTTMKPTPCPTTTIRSTSGYPVRYVNKHSGKFAYKRSQPAYARVAFLAPYDTSLGMFSVEYADGTSYQTGWFDLHPNKEDPASIHAVPESGSARDAHNAWLAGIRAACPSAHITERDFESFIVDEDGNAQVIFEGAPITLNREWDSYTPGDFGSSAWLKALGRLPNLRASSLKVDMLLRVNSDGSSLLQLSCNNEFPYARRLKLAGMGLGKAYRLTPGEEGETLHDVVSGLKEKCPHLPEEYLSVEKWETVRFASRSELFVTGNYVLDRAWNQYMSWTDADSLS